MKKLSIQSVTLIILGAFAVTSISLTLFQMNKAPKVVVVDLAKLYGEFELKKQFEQQVTTVQDTRQKLLDSLELSLNILARNIQNMDQEADKTAFEQSSNEFEVRRQEYAERQGMFDKDNQAMLDQYNEEIWKQLNQYVEDYGKEHGIECIIGGDGSGNVMYSEDGVDLTDELVVYCNARYKGESK